MSRALAAIALLLACSCTSSVARRTDVLLTRYQMYGFTGSVLVAERARVVLDRSYGLPERAFDAGIEPAGMTETSFWGEPALPMPRLYAGNSDEELEPVGPRALRPAAGGRVGEDCGCRDVCERTRPDLRDAGQG